MLLTVFLQKWKLTTCFAKKCVALRAIEVIVQIRVHWWPLTVGLQNVILIKDGFQNLHIERTKGICQGT